MYTLNKVFYWKIDFWILPFNQMVTRASQKKSRLKTKLKLVLDSLAERELILYLATLFGSLFLLGVLNLFST
ncbi:MAG: hypothetical protein MJE63_28065 [Proteobacteria bacterium]|nr:hypothetical protein [Pseudomonadota bacterium]